MAITQPKMIRLIRAKGSMGSSVTAGCPHARSPIRVGAGASKGSTAEVVPPASCGLSPKNAPDLGLNSRFAEACSVGGGRDHPLLRDCRGRDGRR